MNSFFKELEMKTFEELKSDNLEEQSMIDDDDVDFFANVELPNENTSIESSQNFSIVPQINEMEMKTCKELKSDNLEEHPMVENASLEITHENTDIELSQHFSNVPPIEAVQGMEMNEHLSYNAEAIFQELIFVPETTHKSLKKKIKKKLSLSKILSSKLQVGCPQLRNFKLNIKKKA